MIGNRPDELEEFKTHINLGAFISQEYGYAYLRAESSDAYSVLRREKGDKIIVSKSPQSHWIYFHVYDPADSGSIIDFIQRRSRVNLGQVRAMLRPMLNKPLRTHSDDVPNLTATPFNRELIVTMFSKCQAVTQSDYLASRGILNTTLEDHRFRNMVQMDHRGNMVFPHYDQGGLTGYEIKNEQYSGFAKGGKRALWSSQCFESDTHVAFFEGAIDALSYHQIKGLSTCRYHSVGGAIGGHQQPLIRAVLEKCARLNRAVISGFDNDEAGERFHNLLSELAPNNLEIKRDCPPDSDWNGLIDLRKN